MDVEFYSGLLTGGGVIGILSYILKIMLEVRFKSAIKDEYDRKLEEFKQKIRSQDRIEEIRWKTAHNACLEALEVIDAYFSHSLVSEQGEKPVPQLSDTAQARRCHNKLIIACTNTILVDTFNEICFHNKTEGGFKNPPTTLLNRFRNEIRKELGFGNEVKLDKNAAWFGKLVGDNNK